MSSVNNAHTHTAVTSEETAVSFGVGQMKHDVIIPAGTRCVKVDGGGAIPTWVVDDLSFIHDKSSALYNDAARYRIKVEESNLVGIAPVDRHATRAPEGNPRVSGVVDRTPATALREQYKDLIFTLQDAWGYIHGGRNEDLKGRAQAILHECGDYADTPLVISTGLNVRIYRVLADSKDLILGNTSFASQSLRNKLSDVLDLHSSLTTGRNMPTSHQPDAPWRAEFNECGVSSKWWVVRGFRERGPVDVDGDFAHEVDARARAETLNAAKLDLNLLEARLFEGKWSHLFGPGRAETQCRVVVDVANDNLVAAEAFDGQKWVDLSSAERSDLAESLFSGNDVSAGPEDWNLSAIESLPQWAASRGAPDILQVATAMDRVSWARRSTSAEPGWWNNPDINDVVNEGVRAGYLRRSSTTQVEWSEAGCKALRYAYAEINRSRAPGERVDGKQPDSGLSRDEADAISRLKASGRVAVRLSTSPGFGAGFYAYRLRENGSEGEFLGTSATEDKAWLSAAIRLAEYKPGELQMTSREFGSVWTPNVLCNDGSLGMLERRTRLEIRKLQDEYAVFSINRRYLSGENPRDVYQRQEDDRFATLGQAADYVGRYIGDYAEAAADNRASAIEAQAESDAESASPSP